MSLLGQCLLMYEYKTSILGICLQHIAPIQHTLLGPLEIPGMLSMHLPPCNLSRFDNKTTSELSPHLTCCRTEWTSQGPPPELLP